MYIVYGTDSCPWCDRAVELIEKHGEEFSYVDVGDDEKAQAMFRAERLRSVPQVFLGDSRIGGYEALRSHMQGQVV